VRDLRRRARTARRRTADATSTCRRARHERCSVEQNGIPGAEPFAFHADARVRGSHQIRRHPSDPRGGGRHGARAGHRDGGDCSGSRDARSTLLLRGRRSAARIRARRSDQRRGISPDRLAPRGGCTTQRLRARRSRSRARDRHRRITGRRRVDRASGASVSSRSHHDRKSQVRAHGARAGDDPGACRRGVRLRRAHGSWGCASPARSIE
jgi:hypothetical protein